MRKYYIYAQEANWIDYHSDFDVYKWSYWKYLGVAHGTKSLFLFFKNQKRYCQSYPIKSFYTKQSIFTVKVSIMRIGIERISYYRYAIVDDKGRFRDFNELTQRYRRKTRYNYMKKWRDVRVNICMNEKRKELTPEEINEYKNDYGFSPNILCPKAKRKILPSSYDRCHVKKIQRCWKYQSKRKRQYKNEN